MGNAEDVKRSYCTVCAAWTKFCCCVFSQKSLKSSPLDKKKIVVTGGRLDNERHYCLPRWTWWEPHHQSISRCLLHTLSRTYTKHIESRAQRPLWRGMRATLKILQQTAVPHCYGGKSARNRLIGSSSRILQYIVERHSSAMPLWIKRKTFMKASTFSMLESVLLPVISTDGKCMCQVCAMQDACYKTVAVNRHICTLRILMVHAQYPCTCRILTAFRNINDSPALRSDSHGESLAACSFVAALRHGNFTQAGKEQDRIAQWCTGWLTTEQPVHHWLLPDTT